MIHINLLPEEFRRRERTPIRIFAATLVAAIVITGLGGTFSYLWFGKLASAEETLARLNEDREGLEPQLKHHAALSTEIAETQKWQDTLRELRNSKYPWARKLDQLIDHVSQAGDQDKYTIWFTDLAVQQSLDSKKDGGTFSGKGMSSSDDLGKVANFISDVRRTEFFKDFSSIGPPEGKVSDGELNAVEFPFNLVIAVRDVKKQDANKNKAVTPAAPAAK